jgi:hypothetical protein
VRLRGKKIAARLKREGINADQMTPEWKAVILADPCVYCVLGKPVANARIEMEHIHPRTKGGTNGWTNIAPACSLHNEMKAYGPLWWMLWRLNERRLGFSSRRVLKFRHVKGQRVPVDWVIDYTRLMRRKSHVRSERRQRIDAVDPDGGTVSD